jgi:hypothetical protein
MLMVLFLTPTVLGRGARRRDRAEDDRFLGQMLASTGVASFVTAATFDCMSYPSFTFMVALMLGLSGAWWGFARADAGELDDPNRRRILGGRLHRPWEEATVERRPPFARLRSSVRPVSAGARMGSMDVNRR